jgi:hypothetical protein
MKSRPILFSAPMVRAILDGSKTQTRRAVKPQPHTLRTEGYGWPTKQGGFVSVGGPEMLAACPYGQPGDELWVRETWQVFYGNDPRIEYRAGGVGFEGDERCYATKNGMTLKQAGEEYDGKPSKMRWQPSIFMPRWASRITLTITEVRVQRLNEISEVDAMAEGIENPQQSAKSLGWAVSATSSFRILWESINGKGSWDANPWVWAITFTRKEAK